MATTWSTTQPTLPSGSSFSSSGSAYNSDKQNTYEIWCPNGYVAPLEDGQICIKFTVNAAYGSSGAASGAKSLAVTLKLYKNNSQISTNSVTFNCTKAYASPTVYTYYIMTDAVSTDSFMVRCYVTMNNRERCGWTGFQGTPIEGLKIYTKVSNAWKKLSKTYIKINSAWKQTSAIYIKVNGSWKKI